MKRQHGLRAFAMAAMTALALFSTPALAQSTEREQLAQEFAAIIFEAADMKTALATSMEDEAIGNSFDEEFGKARPEWKEMIISSIIEEMDHDMPEIVWLVGDALGKHLTVEELRVAVVVFKDPAFVESFKAAAKDQKVANPREPSAKTYKLLASPAGRSLGDKLGEMDPVFASLEDDFLAEILPGALRRFADKAEPAEIARRARR